MMTDEGVISIRDMLYDIKGWQDKATGKSFFEVKKALRSFIFDMQKAFESEEAGYRAKLEKEDEQFNKNLSAVRSKYLDAMNRLAEAEYDKTVSSISEEWNGPNGEKTLKKARISSLNFEFIAPGILDKAAGLITSKGDKRDLEEFREKKTAVSALAIEADRTYKEVQSAAAKLRDAKMRLNARVYEEAKRTETASHNRIQENIEAEYRNRKEELFNRYNSNFSLYFNRHTFNDVWGNVQVFMRNAKNYSYSRVIPRNLYIGKRTFTVKAEKEFCPEVINMIKGIDFKGAEASSEEIRITLPFFRSIEEGYSVYLETKDIAASASDSVVKNYVWKILMNFTAGQTVPLLLDFDITTALTEFKEIGENSGNRMITRPWSDEEDIEKELKKVALEHTNLTTSYSNDVESRMEREPVYFVAARNFPKGFTRKAAENLSKIFTAGSRKGFFGIVQANIAELVTKGNDVEWQTLVATIKNASLCIEETQDGYFVKDDGEDDSFEFEIMTDVPDDLKEIKAGIISGVKNYSRQIEKFEFLFSKDAANTERTDMHDMNTWYLGDASEIFEVPLGISGASNVQKLLIRSTAQHALISGITGSGKSALLRTIIMAAMMKYTPEHVNFYLIDFKEGVEFEPFSRYKLPWMKAIALNTQRIFALEILEFIEEKFKDRAKIMSGYNVNDLSKIPGEVFPRIILIFDEIQELLRIDDSITKKCVNILAKLVSEGRAMNINIIIASQNFAVCKGIEDIKANMAIRIALKGEPESTKIIMGDDFDCSQLDQGGDGYGAINEASGEKGRTNFFSGGYISADELTDMLAKFEATMRNRESATRIMSIYIERDRENKFNRFIRNSEVVPNKVPSEYELMLGDEFLIDRKREYFISPEKGENLAVIGKDEETARSLFVCSVLSALYGELASDAKNIKNELVRFIDLSDEYENDSDYFAFMSGLFSRQMSRVGLSKSEEMINDTYNILTERINGSKDSSERLFFMIFGIDSLTGLRKEKSSSDGELTAKEKLIRILKDGPEYGINSIIWSRSLSIFRKLFGDDLIQEEFSKRIFFGESKEDAEYILGAEEEMTSFAEKTVFYKDVEKTKASAFRVFELPERSWVEKINEVYNSYGANS